MQRRQGTHASLMELASYPKRTPDSEVTSTSASTSVLGQLPSCGRAKERAQRRVFVGEAQAAWEAAIRRPGRCEGRVAARRRNDTLTALADAARGPMAWLAKRRAAPDATFRRRRRHIRRAPLPCVRSGAHRRLRLHGLDIESGDGIRRRVHAEAARRGVVRVSVGGARSDGGATWRGERGHGGLPRGAAQRRREGSAQRSEHKKSHDAKHLFFLGGKREAR